MNIKNTRMLELGILAISKYLSEHYSKINSDDYFLLDSLKKLMVEHKNKLKKIRGKKNVDNRNQ